MQAFGIFLLLAALIAQGNCNDGETATESAIEAADKLMHALSYCDHDDHTTAAATKVTEEVLTAIQMCSKTVVLTDRMCMFPCLANELELVNRGRLVPSAVSTFLYKQFGNLDTAKRLNWTEGIKNCFKRDADGDMLFPIGYDDCSHKKEELLSLRDCIFAARHCPLAKKQGRIFGIDDIILLAIGVAASLAVSETVEGVKNSGCQGQAWCRNGRCAVDCDATFVPDEWCHSTKTYSQSYEYVSCTCDEQCHNCWKCASPCTVFGVSGKPTSRKAEL